MDKPTFLKWWLLGVYFLGINFILCGNQLYAQINTFPFLEDFESGNGGWVASPIVPALSSLSSWVWVTPATGALINTAASGTKCWVTGNNGNVTPPLVPYAHFSNEYSQIVSPIFDFTNLANPGIKMNIWWESQYSVDGTVFQSSIDGGSTWQTVGSYNDPVFWYNDNTVSGGISGPGGQTDGWTGRASTGTGSNGWREAQHGLEGLGGQPSVRFRFAFSSDANSTTVADGFAFDDIFIADRPALNLGEDTVVCFADTVFLNACINGATSYSWSSNPLIDTLCTKVVVSSGLYIVTVIDTLDFIIIDTVDVIVSETNVILPPDQLICPGDTVLLDADNPTASHLWLPDSVQSQFLEVSENGTYTVEVTDGFGCFEVDSISVFIDFVPDVDLGPDTIICPGESIVLDAGSANPGTTYSWTPFAATTQTIFVSSPGDFQVVVTTGAGCVATDSVQIGFSLDPVVNLGPDRVECGTFSLDAGNPGASFIWSTNDTSQTITTDQGGLYWVEVFNEFGCSTRDSVLITPALNPVVNLGPNEVICGGSPVILDPNVTGISYLWNTGDTSATLSVTNPGVYSVLVTSGQNCEGSDTIQVSLSTLQVELGSDITICDGDSILLDAGITAEAYSWSSGETTQTIWANQDALYSVTVSDSTGCELVDQIQVSTQSNFVPQFSVGGDLVLLGQVQFSDQSTGNSSSWLWDFGDGMTSTDAMPMHVYQSIGTFTVCLTVSDGICTNTICQEVNIDIFDGIEEDLGLDMLVYPNPNSGQFTIDLTLPSPKEISVQLFDLSGKQIFSYDAGNVQSWTKEVNESQLAKGLYLLKVSVDQVDVYRKISID